MENTDDGQYACDIIAEECKDIIIVEGRFLNEILAADIAIFSYIIDDSPDKLLLLCVQNIAVEIFAEFLINGFLAQSDEAANEHGKVIDIRCLFVFLFRSEFLP